MYSDSAGGEAPHPLRNPSKSSFCGREKKDGFIVINIGSLCETFLALCLWTKSVYMESMDGAGILNSSERAFYKCQRARSSGQCYRLHNTISPIQPLCGYRRRGARHCSPQTQWTCCSLGLYKLFPMSPLCCYPGPYGH